MPHSGRLLASGRDADILECGPSRVLRRSRRGRTVASEARTMEHARAHGYPVPAVDSVSDDGTDLVMERIDGRSMLDALQRRPWTIRGSGRLLGQLHRQLHEIAAPDWLDEAPFGRGDRLLHLDLHPLNVLMAERGPVVIDWTNARRGDGTTDVALSWLLIGAAEPPTKRLVGTVLGWG